MKVTNDLIPFHKLFYSKLTLLTERVKRKKDILMLIDGAEGEGKSTMAAGCMKVFAHLLNREFTIDNVFFDLEDMINFATKTEKQLIWWDEAALGGLRREWSSKYQLKLIKLLMIARKKQHVYIFNIPRVKRLAEDLIDRATCLIHVYSPDEITVGRFAYYRKRSLMALYEKWQSSKKMHYNLYYDFIGDFSDYIEKYKVIDPTLYDAKKDKAIMNLTVDKVDKRTLMLERKLKALQFKIGNAKMGLTELSKMFEVPISTIKGWKNGTGPLLSEREGEINIQADINAQKQEPLIIANNIKHKEKEVQDVD